MITPITNEPIFLLIQQCSNTLVVPIFPAGARIPSPTVSIDNLYIGRDDQQLLELPLCVTHASNVIHNLVIPCDGVGMNTRITLEVSMDANRTVHATAKVGNQTETVSLTNALQLPITRKERITTMEENTDKKCVDSGGKATKADMLKLYHAYQNEGEYIKAAEVAEDLYKQFNAVSLNSIGLMYSNGGDRDKAIQYYQKAIEEKPSATVFFNLALEYKYTDRQLYIYNLEQSLVLDPSYGLARYELYSAQIHTNPTAKQRLRELFNEWKAEYEADVFYFHISWLISCARSVGEYAFANSIKSSSNNLAEDSQYNTATILAISK